MKVVHRPRGETGEKELGRVEKVAAPVLEDGRLRPEVRVVVVV